MSKQLWLLRHAKAARPANISDIERPLSKKGKKDAELMGKWMAQQGLIPDCILCSPAKRTMATAKRINLTCNLASDIIFQDYRLYSENLDDLKTALAECKPQSDKVLIIGHNPSLENLLSWLLERPNTLATRDYLHTATLARISINSDWPGLSPHHAKLISITHIEECLI
ncbi:MAG: histidine phosphatase family protein [Methylococcaceae bacterium]